MAEEERFELSRRTSRPTVFKTAAFNRSATPPSKRYLTRNPNQNKRRKAPFKLQTPGSADGLV